MEEKFPKRKNMRFKFFDYNASFTVFLTICTKERKQLLSHIVGTGVPDGPLSEVFDQFTVVLSNEGKIVDKYIHRFNEFYDHLTVENFVIMPNHVHLLISFYEKGGPSGISDTPKLVLDRWNLCVAKREPPVPTNSKSGPSGTPVPTKIQNSEVSKFVSALKRFTNKEIGTNIWQSRSFDHVIRDREDFLNHKKYILENPIHWLDDELYTE